MQGPERIADSSTLSSSEYTIAARGARSSQRATVASASGARRSSWSKNPTHSPVARSRAEFVASEDRARYRAVAKRMVEGHPVEDFEASLVAKDGRSVVCRGWAVAQFTNGVLTGAVAGYRDCTAERAVDPVGHPDHRGSLNIHPDAGIELGRDDRSVEQSLDAQFQLPPVCRIGRCPSR